MSFPARHISPSERAKIQWVLDDAGYSADLLVRDPRLVETASLLVTLLLREGGHSRSALAEKLECRMGKAGKYRQPLGFRLARYAIQGLPAGLQPLLR